MACCALLQFPNPYLCLHFFSNPSGVRFGSSEIYDVVESLPEAQREEIIDFLAVGQSIENGSDERVILFIKLNGLILDDTLRASIGAAIRGKRSPRHVPFKVVFVLTHPDILSGIRSFKSKIYHIP
jgi:acetoacetyl-CoA synthetase